jgi:hypothetical protein
LPNAIGVLGLSVAAGGVTPVSATVCVEPVTPLLSSVNVSVAVLVPTAVGVNVTLQVQLPLEAATLEPLVQVVPPAAMAKSPELAPVIVTVAKWSAVVPVFVSVPPIGALVVLTACAGNETVGGASTTTGAVPVPVSATVCVDPAVAPLSSVNVSVAVREPSAVGVNFTLHVQLAVAATVTGVGRPVAQLVPAATIEKSDAFAPEIATAVMFSTSVPVLLRVPFCAALDVLTSWLPKAAVAVDGEARGAMPFPESVIGAGFAIPETVIVMLALRALMAAGSNVTLNVQLAAGASWPLAVVGHVVAGEAKAKSAAFVPVKAMLVMLNAAPPLLVIVTFFAVLVVFTRWLPKAIVPADSVAVGGVTPVPDKLTVCVVGLASSVKVSVAANVLAVVGVNVKSTVQVLPGATVDPFVQVVPVVAMANSLALAPPSATVVICSVSVPPLVSVTACARLVVPMIWLPKATGLGAGVACGNTPVPVRANVCGLPEALSATDTVALLPRSAVGLKVVAITQVPPAVTVPTVRQSVPLPGVARAKSPGFAPVMVMPEIVKVPEPV